LQKKPGSAVVPAHVVDPRRAINRPENGTKEMYKSKGQLRKNISPRCVGGRQKEGGQRMGSSKTTKAPRNFWREHRAPRTGGPGSCSSFEMVGRPKEEDSTTPRRVWEKGRRGKRERQDARGLGEKTAEHLR